ncbi:hypothetical protein AMATHDRAFT_5613 [Amanita thiersii Skay4041]|uniref:BTB domain-containing protein n=1 Tax=Amanita thiersii Skay4041 TaxID=703135 RepID=A0A2A9NLT9_9AGAR|nr:hypothetical protein AMATHDRAFT_5613 [Amanita thiersii Skay4041]
MTVLHACILTRNFKVFQRLLTGRWPVDDGRSTVTSAAASSSSALEVSRASSSSQWPHASRASITDLSTSTSAATSTTTQIPPTPPSNSTTFTVNVNVNERDDLGRTALHLACSLPDCVEYVRALLKHPQVNPNLVDAESHYTPLHRAILLLLQRHDVDTSLKDLEGYTAFDLYNASIEGTKPDLMDQDAELFMWGTNVNATLGFPDGNNRTYPDHVTIQPKPQPLPADSLPLSPRSTLKDRFAPIHVKHVGMSRLHTVVVTSEGSNKRPPRGPSSPSFSPSHSLKAPFPFPAPTPLTYTIGGGGGGGSGNLRMCGFGSFGRLGGSSLHHAQQYALAPLSLNTAFPANAPPIIRVALGQDHTLVLNKAGEVYSWGMNRFGQLGYVVKPPQSTGGSGSGDGGAGAGAGASGEGNNSGGSGKVDGRASMTFLDDNVQTTPRRVQDALRREVVIGIAASKVSSACWTAAGDLFTWGTNFGQLGYERATTTTTIGGQQPYLQHQQQQQLLPRKVSKIAQPVVDVAMTDTAMACLLLTRDVTCFWADKEIKINFPIQTFPSKIQPYRPPQALRDADIAKVTACDDVFAAASVNGEVFVFVMPDVGGAVDASGTKSGSGGGGGGGSNGGRMTLVRPQRAWALKKKFSAVRDVALGGNGSVIVCTESGHVFVRTRAALVKTSTSSNLTSSSFGGASGGSGSLEGSSSSSTQVTTPANPLAGKVGSNFTFVRVPGLQRVTRVFANSTGTFGVLKVDYRHRPIEVVGNGVAEDLKEVMPFVAMWGVGVVCGDGDRWKRMSKGGRYGLGLKTGCDSELLQKEAEDMSGGELQNQVEAEEGEEDEVSDDVHQLKRLCKIIQLERKGRGGYPKDRRLPFDADVMVHTQSEAAFPAHRVVLAARSEVLCSVLRGNPASLRDDKANVSARLVLNKGKGVITTSSALSPSPLRPFPSISTCGKLIISGCHALSVLILLTYLYSDELLSIWDLRVASVLQKERERIKVTPGQVKQELQALARLLELPLLSEALEPWVKRTPVPSLEKNMERLWCDMHQRQDRDAGGEEGSTSWTTSGKGPRGNDNGSGPLSPDVILELQDREVWCHSVLLRARSDLFASFFGEEVWTVNRRGEDGVVRVDMRHLRWHVMEYVLKFTCCGREEELFKYLDFAGSVDDVLDFMFSVMSAATELLLDRLVLLCSSVILQYANIYNAGYILSEATHYNAKQLVERLQTYMAVNLETLLESRMLDELPHRLIKQLGVFTRQKQAEKSPVSRTTVLLDAALVKHADWLELQDIPEPIVRLNRPLQESSARGISNTNKKSSRVSLASDPAIPTAPTNENAPVTSTAQQRAIRRPPSGDDIFVMDDHEDQPAGGSHGGKSSVWKASSVPRVDMRTVMAEAAASVSGPGSPSRFGTGRKTSQPQTTFRTASKESGSTSTSTTVLSAVVAGASTGASPNRVPGASPWRIPISQNAIPGKSTPPPSTPPPSTPAAAPNTLVASPPQPSATPRTREFGQQRQTPGTPLSPEPITPSKSRTISSTTTTTPTPSGRPPQAPSPELQQKHTLGPVITPTRHPPSAKANNTNTPSIRRVSGKNGKAWVLPPAQPSTIPNPSTTSTHAGSGISFVAIQQLQLEQASEPQKDKRSLREIQAEEEARQQEEDFLKWWAAEEERVRLESEAVTRALTGSSQGPSDKTRKKARGPKGTQHGKPDSQDRRPQSDAQARGSKSGDRRASGRSHPRKSNKGDETNKNPRPDG